jgi:hypothetical protein
MIKKQNIKFYAIDVEGSDFIHFVLDKEVKNDAIGEYYWQGKTSELGNEFMIMESSWDETMEDRELKKFLSKDAIELVDDVIRNYYSL